MEKITLELENGVAGELLKAIAMRIEYSKDWQVEQALTRVAEQLEEKAEAGGLKGAKGALARMRYPIKRVSVSYYESNPKPKPPEKSL